MAFINYVSADQIDALDRVPDDDRILQIHGVHGRVMRLHYDLYMELMHGPSPLSRVQRELIGVVVSSHNECHY